jgi:uncharacterized membrane protein YgaE (UPF0421/DUF939 family)
VNVEIIKGLQLAVRAAAAGGISYAIAELFRLDYPVFAFAAAVIATDLTPRQSQELGLRRIVATIVGALCGAVLGLVVRPGAWTLGLSILVAMLVCQLLGARDGSRVAGYTCGIIVISESLDPWMHATLRFVETVLGVAVAWLISYVPKLIRIAEAEDERT